MKAEMKTSIMEATIQEFNVRGTKFTMDDLAKRLGMSKKTIYASFQDKETLLLETVNYCFNQIKENKLALIEDETLDIVERIRRAIVALPEQYLEIDWRQLNCSKDKFPNVYAYIEKRLESEWEPIIALIEQGIREDRIRNISIPVLKTMVEATIEHFLESTVLIDYEIAYKDALNEMISIIIEGISIR